jgi:oxygen-independent coproporphyrinogen-3 oxidase
MNGDLSFYIHIPYCVKRCGYCDFNTYTPAELREGGTLETVSGDYIDAVLTEIRQARTHAAAVVPSIFFGGGTPSLLPAQDLGRVINEIRQSWTLSSDCEITLEANPDSVDSAKLEELLDVGFNRISFGMQSAAPHVLATLDRTHIPSNVEKAIRSARTAGFTNVSVDLIYGTPGESLSDWRETVESALALPIEHISAYALIVEEGTKLAAKIKRGEIASPNDDLMADMYLLIDELAEESGLTWYELSNWAKPGFGSRHNMAYWRNAHWWGAGPGAHSHLNGVRWWNVKHPTAYKERLSHNQSPEHEREVLTSQQMATESLMLGIRMREGISLAALTPEQGARLAEFHQSGYLDNGAWQSGVASLTATGRLIADRIVREILL